jgi:hypothetical protein
MNTESNNKLLAEFVELKTPINGYYISPFDKDDILTTLELKFHSDWNWIMQVVEKIEETSPISIIISCGNCEVYNCETSETMFFVEGVKIEAVYNACVRFVEWYNAQKN